jgi:glycosyltransferase involved in cell wall biosynthesis
MNPVRPAHRHDKRQPLLRTPPPLTAHARPYLEKVMDEPALCDVVIPCRDEAPALPALLANLPPGFRALVVDNGSRDDTTGVAHRLGATVVDEPRPGYGAAVHAGLEAATAEYVAVMDGDGSMDPADLVPLLDLVVEGAADLAVGRRRPTRSGVWPRHARAGNAVVLWWLRRRIGLPLHDIAPMRVSRRDRMIALGVEDRRFGYPVELLQRAAAADWRFVELDIDYHPRAAGTRSKVSGSVVGTVRAARDFARVLS